MRPQRQVAVLLLLILAVACASTPDEESSRYWAARSSFVSVQSSLNQALQLDNERIREGHDPIFSERDRQVILIITQQAFDLFEKLEPMLGDGDRTSEIMLGIQQIQALGFQLALVYQGKS